MPQRRDDPYLNFNFRVEIDGVAIAGFSEADLPEGRIEAVAYREGTDRVSAARLLPGRVEWGPVVLRRGFTGDAGLFQWWSDVLQGNVARRTVAIVLLDEQRAEVARWTVRRAWPRKWEGPQLRGRGNDVAIETLELAHEGVELDD
ncbi:MAG TPA: phage tail protein [Solirubrobacteraceae bacterium]|nr:phage tail protein [Gaiellaceae bacterium]HSD78629.1 phage tail protein [Solirubrobacteraceae bacterium]